MTRFKNEEVELAWAAGFFDGEGNTRLNKKTLVLQISQIDRQVLDRFQKAVGLGKVYGAYFYSYCKHPLYSYQANNKDTIEIFKKIRPYLSESKDTQATNAIANWMKKILIQ